MKTNQNAANYALEAKINAALAAMPADRRPELSNRRKVVSVAYQAADAFEATDVDGHVESVTRETASKWIA